MRLASDTGGTFTDLVVEEDDGRITMYKSPTVPDDPVLGVLRALELAAEDRGLSLQELMARADTFIHGTTHAINAIITGNVARTALLVTKGHRDILVFREGGRVEPFNQSIPFPRPYIPRDLTYEIPERILSTGAIHRDLDEAAVIGVLQSLKEQQVEAVAVCLLWATINPAHELRVGELIAEHLPGVPYTLAHDVNPTLREFRRASSAAIDASLKPLMGHYLSGLTDRIRGEGFTGDIMLLTSSGGMVDAAEVARSPIKVINSGPSMAPISGHYYARAEAQADDVIVADTGGTTYDISLVRKGVVPITRELWIGRPLLGHLVGYPSVEVKSVGAGGGSIAHVDQGGLLRVGPQSAGAKPGPVCYRQGGTKPTVTDASVALGHIDPDFFLGGRIKLDRPAAIEAIRKQVAEPLGMSVDEASWQIIALATEGMVQAIADITVAQGIDPANAVLIGGGGAAGLNSTFIARRLGCKSLVIPETGAALSAAGAMMSPLISEYATSIFVSSDRFDREALAAAIERLRAKCEDFASRSPAANGAPRISFVAEARYEGQVWDIDVKFDPQKILGPDGSEIFRAGFDDMHEQIFAVRDPGSAVEIIGIRATLRADIRRDVEFRLHSPGALSGDHRPREIYFHGYGRLQTPVLRLEAIAPGRPGQGPAIIESAFTTIVVDPDARFHRSGTGSIVIHP
ncbi:hydantoinase/oxoprolinase family protein [Paracoccus kondratievae]|uniref:hydantoinase/oxoprolinase family protein n=1 Tax=Paracoccus kondratievae TaxID=135740 RepID=UPI00126633DF|nr:hydantoinase/oxoprolinase family protein [Paracoccus kondratievae]QFQ89102.1 hydantoinase/oxoprolinase family protein [Paracoccus kondratievae]